MERSYADFYEPSRWQKAKRRFKKLGLWLWGALGLGAFVGGLCRGGGQRDCARARADLVCLAKEQFRKPAPGTQFTILISNLAGDSDGRQTNLVRDTFLEPARAGRALTCRVVTLDLAGGSLADAEAAAQEQGRALLARSNADLLIWGEVKKADRELSLWFLGSGSSTLGATILFFDREASVTQGFPS